MAKLLQVLAHVYRPGFATAVPDSIEAAEDCYTHAGPNPICRAFENAILLNWRAAPYGESAKKQYSQANGTVKQHVLGKQMTILRSIDAAW